MNSETDVLDELLESCSQKEPDGGGNIRPLFNPLEPAYEVQHEKYSHRAIAYLLAAGMTDKEIADKMELSPVTVGYLKKQEFMQPLVLEEIRRMGQGALDILSKEAVAAASRLIEIATAAENLETKRKANNDILDRVYGKPNQPMSVSNKSASEYTDAELANIISSNAKRN